MKLVSDILDFSKMESGMLGYPLFSDPIHISGRSSHYDFFFLFLWEYYYQYLLFRSPAIGSCSNEPAKDSRRYNRHVLYPGEKEGTGNTMLC